MHTLNHRKTPELRPWFNHLNLKQDINELSMKSYFTLVKGCLLLSWQGEIFIFPIGANTRGYDLEMSRKQQGAREPQSWTVKHRHFVLTAERFSEESDMRKPCHGAESREVKSLVAPLRASSFSPAPKRLQHLAARIGLLLNGSKCQLLCIFMSYSCFSPQLAFTCRRLHSKWLSPLCTLFPLQTSLHWTPSCSTLQC